MLQRLAGACRESLAEETMLGRRPRIVVNCDCLTVGCIATILSLAVNRHLEIQLDFDYTYAVEQVRRLNREADADVLITVDGSFVLAGAMDYRIVAPLHTEKQYDVVFQPHEGRRLSARSLLLIRKTSWEEQSIIQPPHCPITPCVLEDFDAFKDRIVSGHWRPGDRSIMPLVMVSQLKDVFQLATGLDYDNFVSMSFHRRWFRGGSLVPCMRQFLELFTYEWNYLRADWIERGGVLARDLLSRDHPDTRYSAKNLLDRLWSFGLEVGPADATVAMRAEDPAPGSSRRARLPSAATDSADAPEAERAEGQAQPGIERLGRNLPRVEFLENFDKVLSVCRQQQRNSFTLAEASRWTGVKSTTLQYRLGKVSRAIKMYFTKFLKVTVFV